MLSGEICFICRRGISARDAEKGNTLVKMAGIPGLVHKRCKGELDVRMVAAPVNTEDLTPMLPKKEKP